jgi:hypothetical protein
MTTNYVDPVTVHDPTTGSSPPALWGDTVRNDLEFFARPPGVVLETTADQSAAFATGTWNNVTWNAVTDLRDTDTMHGTTDVITIPFTGWYHVCGAIVWAGNATGNRMVRYTVNAAGDYRLAQAAAANASFGTRVPFSQDVKFNANDQVRISCLQNSGSSLLVITPCHLTIRFVAQA